MELNECIQTERPGGFIAPNPNKTTKYSNRRYQTSSRPVLLHGGPVLVFVVVSNPVKSCCPLLSHFEYTPFRVAYIWP